MITKQSIVDMGLNSVSLNNHLLIAVKHLRTAIFAAMRNYCDCSVLLRSMTNCGELPLFSYGFCQKKLPGGIVYIEDTAVLTHNHCSDDLDDSDLIEKVKNRVGNISQSIMDFANGYFREDREFDPDLFLTNLKILDVSSSKKDGIIAEIHFSYEIR